MDRGYCKWTLSDKRELVDDKNPIELPDGKKYTWWELRPSTLRVPYTTWAAIKKFIIDSCKVNNQCSEITSWERNVTDIDDWIKKNLQ